MTACILQAALRAIRCADVRYGIRLRSPAFAGMTDGVAIYRSALQSRSGYRKGIGAEVSPTVQRLQRATGSSTALADSPPNQMLCVALR